MNGRKMATGLPVVADVDPAPDVCRAQAGGGGPRLQPGRSHRAGPAATQGDQEIDLQIGIGVQRFVGDDGAQGVSDHVPAGLPFGDGGSDLIAGLGAGGGVVGGQVTGDLGEADGNEQLGAADHRG